jgi:hypothetical protein
MLFIPERHQALNAPAWNEATARDAIQRIVDATCAAFDPQTLWPTHPRDIEPGEPDLPVTALYHGAAGVIWGLERLRLDAVARVPRAFDATIAGLLEPARRYNAAAGLHSPSYLLGEAGVLLLQWCRRRDPAAADALYQLAEANLHHPTLEQLWGSPGTLVAVVHMIEDLDHDPQRQQRWIELLRRGAEILLGQMRLVRHSAHPDRAVWIWTQDLYGRRSDHLGAGHGYAGNVYPVLRGARWLDAAMVETYEERAAQTLDIAALRADGRVNWDPLFDPSVPGARPKPLVQDCHGAPGIVCRLTAARPPKLLELLRQAGELIWAAGPLVKPPGLCHGTDGNGYALLKLHALTGEARWLQRARAFAMHALRQSEDEAAQFGALRYTLWTGDLGLAMYLSSCVRADPAFPMLDVF